MKGLFRAIARALRAVMRRLRATAAWGAGLVDGAWASLFGGGGYVDEMEYDDAPGGGGGLVDQRDLVAEQVADRSVAQVPSHDWSPPHLVRRAVELRSANKDFAGVFDLDHPQQRRLHAYVTALDESGMRAIRSMPIHTLARHLDNSEFVAAGLRPIERTIQMARDAVEAKVNTPEQAKPRRSRKRIASSMVVTNAAREGRKLSLDDVVTARRRALA